MNSSIPMEASVLDAQPADYDLLQEELGLVSSAIARLLRERFEDDLSPVIHAIRFLEAHSRRWTSPENESRIVGCRDRCLQADASLGKLVGALGLSELEIQILLLTGLSEQHEGYADILRLLHPAREPFATVGLAAQLFCTEEVNRLLLREALGSGNLVSSGAVIVAGDGPLFTRNLLVPSEVWTILQGGNASVAAIPDRVQQPVLAGLSAWFATSPCSVVLQAIRQRQPCTVWVRADDSEVAFQRALALVHFAGAIARPLQLPVSAGLPVRQSIWLQASLVPEIPVIHLDNQESAAVLTPRWPEFSGLSSTLIVCSDSGSAVDIPNRTNVSLSVDALSVASCRDMWSELCPELSADAVTLASRFPVEPFQAERVVQDVRSVEPTQRLTLDAVVQGFQSRTAARRSNTMEYIRPVASWSQLVLPEQQLEQMQDAVQRFHLQETVLDQWHFLVDRRGARGVKMLFCGPPGTGKTLSAEVLANALGVDLMVVDLSKIVSKWIGETEKNLAEVFNEAEQIKAVLFFDEADALFGKRTEVSDAHDRYANLETAYLLTRLERFSGLTILATNFRRNIDAAFVRRLDFIVELREPAAEEREQLWRCHVPDSAPLADDVDLGEIARLFPIVGGQIRNAALSAAYFAAHEKTRISSQHLIKGVRREYEKAGKAFRELAVN